MTTAREGVTFVPPRFVSSADECMFYHTMDLPGYGTVQGGWDLRGKFDEYIGRVSLAGKTVLDVGAASGFLTFEAEQRGASVVSFDIGHGKYQTLLPFKDKLYYRDHARWAEEQTAWFERWKNAYWFAHRHFNSRARVFYGDVHRLPADLGPFDVAIVGAVLEHLNDQVSALASIARLTRSVMVLATTLLDTDERIARFEPSVSNPEVDYTWWTYSRGVYREILAMLGFKIQKISRAQYYFAMGEAWVERATVVAVRVA